LSSIRDRAAASGAASRRVTIVEWDTEVEIRSVSVGQVRDLAAASDSDRFRDTLRLIVAAVYDPETGEQAFVEADVDMLAGQSVGVIEQLAELITDVSGLSDRAVALGKGGS
jgi:hypothetical protein